MAWGDPGVSKLLRLSNTSVAWGTGGMPVANPVQQTGILRELRLLVNATPTFTPGTGTLAADVLGPYNVLTSINLSPNQQAPVVTLSGYGLYLVNLIKSIEADYIAADVNSGAVVNNEAFTDVFSARATTGTAAWKYYQQVPIAQKIRSLGGDIGLWPLQNPAMQLLAQMTPNSASAAPGPYNIFSTTAGQSPYLVTGNATVTLTSPTFELIRELYSVPAAQQDFPPFNLVSTWIEEQPQGASVGGASQFQWMATPLSGLLARVILYVFDSNTSTGVAASLLGASNALQLTYDADTVKWAESGSAAQARQHATYGFVLPQGAYEFDLLGRDLTLADVLNTNTTGNIKLKVSLSSALGGTSTAKVIKQMISPLEVK